MILKILIIFGEINLILFLIIFSKIEKRQVLQK